MPQVLIEVTPHRGVRSKGLYDEEECLKVFGEELNEVYDCRIFKLSI